MPEDKDGNILAANLFLTTSGRTMSFQSMILDPTTPPSPTAPPVFRAHAILGGGPTSGLIWLVNPSGSVGLVLDGNDDSITARTLRVDQCFVAQQIHLQDCIAQRFFGKGDSFFDGSLNVKGDVVLANADCAEDFDVAEEGEAEPGTVMVIDRDGVLHASRLAYDKKVAGVISGAGDFRPGIVLDKRPSSATRRPVALLGKVFCKVDARTAPIDVGDLLTTSATPGHAMKAADTSRAFGTVIGKALRPLDAGLGLIPILIALQ